MPHLRPVLNDIVEPAETPTIVLGRLDGHLLNASVKKTVKREELKYITLSVLEALKVLHDDVYVLTDVTMDNIFANYKEGENRFSEVQLGDLGSRYPIDSSIAKNGTPVAAAIWSSPEVIMETPWNIATDIWSFGTVTRMDTPSPAQLTTPPQVRPLPRSGAATVKNTFLNPSCVRNTTLGPRPHD
ncbi:hypothetical protein BJY01DRAFT_250476 [Aspergillus pseudoustus]|uniref:Protein kinase domain-containing protein n=1 Tax=Aspergillus pseudoustus TaxID=1810923 RepID=A0ABR4JHL7_9EURO